MECEYSVTEGPIGSTSSRWRKLAQSFELWYMAHIWGCRPLFSIMTLSMSSCVPSNAPPLFFFFSITGVLSLSDQLHSGQVSCTLTDWPPSSVYFSRRASGAHHKLPGDGHDNTLFFLFPPLSLSLVVIWVTMRHWGWEVHHCSQSCLMNG